MAHNYNHNKYNRNNYNSPRKGSYHNIKHNKLHLVNLPLTQIQKLRVLRNKHNAILRRINTEIIEHGAVDKVLTNEERKKIIAWQLSKPPQIISLNGDRGITPMNISVALRKLQNEKRAELKREKEEKTEIAEYLEEDEKETEHQLIQVSRRELKDLVFKLVEAVLSNQIKMNEVYDM